MYPGQASFISKGLGILKNINFAGLLDGASKTLNVVNQAIPVIYQAKPIFQNFGTFFKISNALKEQSVIDNHPVTNDKKQEATISPVFYL